MAEERWVHISW